MFSTLLDHWKRFSECLRRRAQSRLLQIWCMLERVNKLYETYLRKCVWQHGIPIFTADSVTPHVQQDDSYYEICNQTIPLTFPWWLGSHQPQHFFICQEKRRICIKLQSWANTPFATIISILYQSTRWHLQLSRSLSYHNSWMINPFPHNKSSADDFKNLFGKNMQNLY